MDKLNTLTEVIRSKVPRLMELTDGCIVYTDIKEDTPTTIGKNGYSISSDKTIIDDVAPGYGRNKYQKITKIIGHEPMLNDVLEFVNNFYDEKTIQMKVERLFNDSEKGNQQTFVVRSWDLSKPYLKDQGDFLIGKLLDMVTPVGDLIQFQVIETYSDDSKTYHYFKSVVDEKNICEVAISIVKSDYQKKLERKSFNFFTNIDMSRPTLKIIEYPKKKGGLTFKTKWR